MDEITYDLHLHSCLSPCGDDEMTPGNIVGMAALIGLDAIALTDHNSCKNCGPFLAMAEEYGLIALPGMELTTMEEIHVLCYFSNLEDAMAFDAYVETRMLPIPNRPKIFGNQILTGMEDEQVGIYDTLLISATEITFSEVFSLVKQYHGVAIPAHVEKTSTSMLSALGMVPPDAEFQAAELFSWENREVLQEKHPYLKSCLLLKSSDAHMLPDIQEPIHTLKVDERSAKGLFLALSGAGA